MPKTPTEQPGVSCGSSCPGAGSVSVTCDDDLGHEKLDRPHSARFPGHDGRFRVHWIDGYADHMLSRVDQYPPTRTELLLKIMPTPPLAMTEEGRQRLDAVLGQFEALREELATLLRREALGIFSYLLDDALDRAARGRLGAADLLELAGLAHAEAKLRSSPGEESMIAKMQSTEPSGGEGAT